MPNLQKSKSLPGLIIKIALTLFLVGFMVVHPSEVFQAAKNGLGAWFNIVFPALLPFFIGSELLMGFGLVRFMGILLEPVMRPFFRLPGAASFVMAVGFTSGFPISAVLTAKLRKEGLCSREEAEHLMSFTNNASPLFMLGAVAVGMFGDARVGYLIALSHYLANLTLGFILRFYKRKSGRQPVVRQDNILRRAVAELRQSNMSETRPFGKILGDAIQNSINTLLMIAGFVISFSVVIDIMKITGVTENLASFISLALGKDFPQGISTALASGIWEVTLGTKITAQAAAPLIFQLIGVSFILGWSGICVHAQVASVVSATDIRMRLFVVTRFLHGLLGALYCYLLAGPGFNIAAGLAEPVFKPFMGGAIAPWWQLGAWSTLLFVKITLFLLTAGLLIGFLKELKIIRLK